MPDRKTLLSKTLESILFPRKCAACGTYLENNEEFLCLECKTKVYRVEPPYCIYCGVGKKYCRCRNYPRAYDGAVAPFYYEGSAKEAIYRLKFGYYEDVSLYLGMELGREIAARYFGVHFDILTCVPSSTKSVSERGFNQSQSIAEHLNLDAQNFPELITDYSLLKKEANISTQHMLGAEARRKNTERAYKLNKNRDVSGKTILLIDDILTTGTTANACASILKLSAAKAVYVATAAISHIEDSQKEIEKN